MKRMKWFLFFVGVLIISIWLYRGNTIIEVTELRIESDSLPESFNGFKIAHVSDLHNATFGEGNASLLALLKAQEPDMIAVTGDVIDSRRTDVEIAIHFLKEAVKIAPVSYVTGNHEARIPEYQLFKNTIENIGVNVLTNTMIELKRGPALIYIAGIEDPAFNTGHSEFVTTHEQLEATLIENQAYTVLLAHRPEHFSLYKLMEVDLVLAGHAHGGQVRLPFIGGFVAPDQGFYPDYTSGPYKEESTTMIVSRGIGNSILPLRVNNPPELVTVTLASSQ
ncbi:phosphoesterase [Halolactibacillus alkaliphilus]|uniref:Phosphoesterase n=2 Tax=Halolactibacillus alkaliphilus TaxID=442899 RepID=A0A511X4L8_9BACI|nr:phosphoesterase [Halolactibacillus alkaliphilus]GGN75646.1 phosphoesterase [Halolactibacillus alkaliphilus]SFP08496.1 hypothetical protein SAMN05720591_1447 [Halolactibacillus alkaliphilus]